MSAVYDTLSWALEEAETNLAKAEQKLLEAKDRVQSLTVTKQLLEADVAEYKAILKELE